jgi:GxxExxY protein
VVELKAVTDPSTADTAQILGYLKASSFRHGLLINFGGPTFRIRKFVV